MKLIFVFLDGVGLAKRHSANPFHLTPMQRLRDEHGIEFFLDAADQHAETRVFKPIDASCDMPGTGQSGTGQFSIYTGMNGAREFGRHYGPFLPSGLKENLAKANIFARLKARKQTVSYANAFPVRYIDTCKKLRTQGKIRSSVLFEAALIEDVALQGVEDLKSQRAVSGDIINHWWGVNPTDGDRDMKKISPPEAAQNLLSLSEKHDAVFFEHFYTDLSGHGRIKTSASEIVGRLDGFLSELIAHLPKQTLLLLTSDHGNFEDASHLSHTTNPVPFLALGKKAGQFSHVETITDIVPTYLEVLDDELKSGGSENQTKVA